MKKDQPLSEFVLPFDGTIHAAMQAINNNGMEVVLVGAADGQIGGLITDGDIRRGLLLGATLQSKAESIMTRDFLHVGPEASRAMVLDLMRARSIQHVPVLSKGGSLIAIHFLTSLLGTEPKPNPAIILAGGRGTRLGALTTSTPKPMLSVAGRPILERIILHLVGYGIRRVFISVNFLASQIEAHFGDGSAFGCEISYLHETKPLGTGGPLGLLPKDIKAPVIVMNGDQITEIDVSRLLERHLQEGGVATMAVGAHQVNVPFATVTSDGHKLLGLEEKPTLTFQINRGIYVLDPRVLHMVPTDREFPITELFDQLLARQESIGVFSTDDEWIDVGRPDDLSRARGRE